MPENVFNLIPICDDCEDLMPTQPMFNDRCWFFYLSPVVRKPAVCICKNKDADQLISAFVFATQIVQSLYFQSPKFQASSHVPWLYSPVCVGPGRKPRIPVFSQRGSFYLNLQQPETSCPMYRQHYGAFKVSTKVYFDLLSKHSHIRFQILTKRLSAFR